MFVLLPVGAVSLCYSSDEVGVASIELQVLVNVGPTNPDRVIACGEQGGEVRHVMGHSAITTKRKKVELPMEETVFLQV